MSESDRYAVQVSWSPDDEGFIAVAPDLPGCSAFGETQASAVAELQDAISAWIEAALAAGNPVPAPSQPELDAPCSGKVLLRMPKTLHAQLVRGARTENVSLNQHIVFLLTLSSNRNAMQQDFRKAPDAGLPFAETLPRPQIFAPTTKKR